MTRFIAVLFMLLPSLAAASSISRAPPPLAQPPSVVTVTPLALSVQQTTTLKGLAATYAKGRNAQQLQAGWESLVGASGKSAGSLPVDEMVQVIMFQIAADAEADLRATMSRMQALIDRKKALRDEIQKMRDYESALGRGLRPALPKPTGVIAGPVPLTTAKEAAAYRARLEAELAKLDDDAQLANVDLQNILQKQQQTLQMMSNISKMLHDTAQAVIRKLGG